MTIRSVAMYVGVMNGAILYGIDIRSMHDGGEIGGRAVSMMIRRETNDWTDWLHAGIARMEYPGSLSYQ